MARRTSVISLDAEHLVNIRLLAQIERRTAKAQLNCILDEFFKRKEIRSSLIRAKRQSGSHRQCESTSTRREDEHEGLQNVSGVGRPSPTRHPACDLE